MNNGPASTIRNCSAGPSNGTSTDSDTTRVAATLQITPSVPSASGARFSRENPVNSHSAPADAGTLRISLIPIPDRYAPDHPANGDYRCFCVCAAGWPATVCKPRAWWTKRRSSLRAIGAALTSLATVRAQRPWRAMQSARART